MSKETENEKVKDVKKGKGGKIVLVVCILLILILLGVVIFLLMGKEDGKEKRNVVVTEENVDELVAQLSEQQKVPAGSYQVTMNPTWKFEDGKTASSNAYVENIETNTNSVYFDVTRSDTEEIIYESPILPVGSHLENIVLDEALSEGSYDAVVTYHILDSEEETISTVRVGITIVINN